MSMLNVKSHRLSVHSAAPQLYKSACAGDSDKVVINQEEREILFALSSLERKSLRAMKCCGAVRQRSQRRVSRVVIPIVM